MSSKQTKYLKENIPIHWHQALQQSKLLQNCSVEQLKELQPFLEEIHFNPGDVIIAEGEISKDIYLILEGQAEIIKSIAADKTTTLRVLAKNHYFGEMALLNGQARSATIRAINSVKLLKISAGFLEKLHQAEKSTYSQLALNLATNLANHLHSTTTLTIESLKKELALNKNRVAGGHFIIYTFTLLTIYILTVNFTSLLASKLITTTLITAPCLIIYSVVCYVMMKHTGYPLSFFGFNLHNWRKNLIKTLVWSAAFCLFITFIKALVISTVPAYQHIPLFDIKITVNEQHSNNASLSALLLFFTLYTLTAPLQEIIFRGAMQSLLANFLTGKKASLWAVLLATMLFCIAHLHVGIWFALIVFIPSLFWGFLYAKQHSLLGPCVSHILVGWWVLYGLGITQFL